MPTWGARRLYRSQLPCLIVSRRLVVTDQSVSADLLVPLAYHSQHANVKQRKAQQLVRQALAGFQGSSCGQWRVGDVLVDVIHSCVLSSAGLRVDSTSFRDEVPARKGPGLIDEEIVEQKLRPVAASPNLPSR